MTTRSRTRPVVLAVSSSGGHWVQMQRLAPAFAGAEVHFATTDASAAALGIATTVATRMWAEPDLTVVEKWLRSVGGALTRAAMASAGLPVPPEMERELGEFVVPWRHPGCPGRKDENDD